MTQPGARERAALIAKVLSLPTDDRNNEKAITDALLTFAAQAAQRENEAIARYVEGHADHLQIQRHQDERRVGVVTLHHPSYERLAEAIRARCHPTPDRKE